MERAEDAFTICDPDQDRAWTGFLDQNRLDSYRIATYSKIGRLDEAQHIAATVLWRLTQPVRKKAVIIFRTLHNPASSRFSQRGSADRSTGPRRPAGDRICHVVAEIRRASLRAEPLATTTAGTVLLGRVRYDETPVCRASALIRPSGQGSLGGHPS